jgi:hypothetical protein
MKNTKIQLMYVGEVQFIHTNSRKYIHMDCIVHLYTQITTSYNFIASGGKGKLRMHAQIKQYFVQTIISSMR